jgi:UPF0716 family protein affecting phage T7 exclusion
MVASKRAVALRQFFLVSLGLWIFFAAFALSIRGAHISVLQVISGSVLLSLLVTILSFVGGWVLKRRQRNSAMRNVGDGNASARKAQSR